MKTILSPPTRIDFVTDRTMSYPYFIIFEQRTGIIVFQTQTQKNTEEIYSNITDYLTFPEFRLKGKVIKQRIKMNQLLLEVEDPSFVWDKVDSFQDKTINKYR